MAKDSFRIKKGLNLEPGANPGTEKGDVRVDSTTGKAVLHNGSSESPLVTEAHAASLTNKTIDGSQNTLSNIPNGATTAASASTPSAIVARDASGNFSAGTVTANLAGNVVGNVTGNVTGNVSGTAANVTGVVAKVNGGSGQDNSSVTFPASGVLVTEAGAETLTNKTVSGAIVPDYEDFVEQSSSPGSPASGKRRVYVKNDGKAYIKDSLGNEVALGSGGAGGIQYLVNNDFETNTAGWAAYADGSANPVDGTGGSPSATITRSTVSPLGGVASGVFTPGALGDGVSTDFTIYRQSLASVLQVEIVGELTGTYADGDVAIWLYDVTNSQLIQPAPYKILNAVGPFKLLASFQTAANSTSLRLMIHQVTANNAYTLKFEASVSPQVITQGTPVTDWTEYPATLGVGWGTPSGVHVRYRRVGDTLEVSGSFVSGTTTGALGSIYLPAGLSIDFTKYNSQYNYTQAVGRLQRLVSATTPHVNQNSSATSFLLGIDSTAPTYVYLSFYATSQTLGGEPVNTVIGNSEPVTFDFKVPVVGWSSQVQLSSDASTAPMEAKVYLSGNVTSTSLYVVPFDRVAYDTAGAFNTTSHGYVVPKPGYWEVKLTSNLAGGNTGSYEVYKNGSPISDGPTNNILFYQGTANNVMSGSIKVKCAANDVLTVVSTANGANIIAGGTFATFSQSLGPSQIAASETVAVTGYKTADVSAGTGVVDLIYDTTDDTHGAYNTSTGVWSCPSPGRYNFYAAALLTGTATGNGKQLLITDTSNTVVRSLAYNNVASSNPHLNGSAQLKCIVGQQYKFRVDRSTDSLAINGSSGTWTNFHIERIGN